jgi:predicted  nucleic acid-binding Zn-ribbon protein
VRKDAVTKSDIQFASDIGVLKGQMEDVQNDIREIKSKVESTNSLLSSLIQQTPDPREYTDLKKDVQDLKVTAVRFKSYIAAAIFIGGLIVGIVNWILDNYDKIKGKI